MENYCKTFLKIDERECVKREKYVAALQMYHFALTVTVERSLVLNVVYERRQPIAFNVYFWRMVLDVARWPQEIIGLTRFFLSLVSQFARAV